MNGRRSGIQLPESVEPCDFRGGFADVKVSSAVSEDGAECEATRLGLSVKISNISTLKPNDGKMMDYSSFSKTKLWMNIAGGIICWILFAYELYACIMNQSSYTSSLLFLFLALNCTFRVITFVSLIVKQKRGLDGEPLVKEERRNGLIISIFSNATAMLLMIVFLIHGMQRTNPSIVFTIFCAACVLCFAWILVMSIQNLRKFDKLGEH